MKGTVIDISDVVRRMMDELEINGSFDVRADGSRSTGWVGKPSGNDFEVVVIIKPLSTMAPAQPLNTAAEAMFRRQNPGR